MAYIGVTGRPLSHRMSRHWYRAIKDTDGRNSLIAKAMREFGRDVFQAEILASVDTEEELRRLEVEAIREHHTFQPDGYNMTRGGFGTLGRIETPKMIENRLRYVRSEENKARIRAINEARRGKPG